MKNKIFGALSFSALLLGFQNCSKGGAAVQFSGDTALASSSTSSSSSTPVICDPLSSQTGCSADTGSGLLGNIYSYPNGSGVNNYIKYGTKLNALIQMSNLNIPIRSWADGFPSPDGTLLEDASGNPLVEFFALDLSGYFTLESPLTSGNYQFALASDDGSILDLNNATIVNNDGTHSVTWACSSNSQALTIGQKVPMRLRYYQGPRFNIALQVFIRPWSQHSQPCNDTGGWEIVPAASLSH